MLFLLFACNEDPAEKYEEPGTVLDDDGDGYTTTEGDCNDQDARISPDAEEICDGIDNNCDGQTDEAGLVLYYADQDGDGYGDANNTQSACTPPQGFVTNATDCDDNDASNYPGGTEVCDGQDNDCDGNIDEDVGTTGYADVDGDGFGDPNAALTACTLPSGYTTNSQDCDDTNAQNYPGANEYCDGVDNDCDGLTDEEAVDAVRWYYDAEYDGYGNCSAWIYACTQPPGYVSEATACDCNDGNPDINPGVDEYCDGIDNDCDGTIDENDAVDADIWYADADNDGYGDASNPTSACSQPAGYVVDATDCNDARGDVNPSAPEVCDGATDEDCDGSIDEAGAQGELVWYEDADADTFGNPDVSVLACAQPSGFVADNTDCDDTDASIYPGAPETSFDGIDSDCDGLDPGVCEETPVGGTVAWDPACTYGYAASGWSVQTEWTTDNKVWASGSTYTHVMAAPAVGPLTDTNGDGWVDELDLPAIVFSTFTSNSYHSPGYLRAMRGDGVELWSKGSVSLGSTSKQINGTSGVGIADIDQDGSPDVVAVASDYTVMALNADGSAKWFSTTATGSYYSAPSFGDLDGDGDIEVVVGNTIYSHTGALVAQNATCNSTQTFPVDLDGDGLMEVVCAGLVYSHTGATTWSTSNIGGRAGVADLDGDGSPEVVQTYNGSFYAYSGSGSLLWSYSTGDAGSGSPVMADFDGDGEVEVGAPFETKFVVMDSDGSLLWTHTIDDSSSRSGGASAADLDGDGDFEIIYSDEETFYIFKGVNGSVLYQDTGHASGTLAEYPLPVDVDRDGNLEIVLSSNDYTFTGYDGIRVLGEAGDEWASTGSIWNQYSYMVTNIEADNQVPLPILSPWLAQNSFRAAVSWSDEAAGAPDMGLYIWGACVDCNAGSLDLYVSFENTGAVFAPSSLPVAIYRDDGGALTLVGTGTIGEDCFPGDFSDPVVFSVATSDVGTDGLVVVVDDVGTGVGTQNECDESNNTASWDDLTCQ